MLDAQHAHRALAPHDRDAGEAVVDVLAGLGLVGEFGMRGGLVEIERLDMLGDGADQALAQRQLGDMHRRLAEPARGVELQHAIAQQVDRADLAGQRLADDLDDIVELGLRVGAPRHQVVQPGQDLAGGGGGGGGLRNGHAATANRSTAPLPSAVLLRYEGDWIVLACAGNSETV